MNKLVYLVLGFICGLMLMDIIYVTDEIDRRYYCYELGMLIMSYQERPKNCPICDYEFHYLFNFRDGELQDLINDYL